MNSQAHWERVYQSKRPDEVSWYRAHLEVSLALIEDAVPDRDARIIDVGGGESTLVDDLLAGAYRHVSVLDLSSTALEVAKARLGKSADDVRWLCGDVTTFPFASHAYDVWHDRAVFHFLTHQQHRVAYVRQVARAVRPGGHVIVATFGPEGPTQCSGLDIVRYDPEELHGEFGASFRLLRHHTESHQTPAGRRQQFIYCYCKVEE
jgi:SAM-dependent methyltransferase